MAVDTLGHLLALQLTPANVDDRAVVGKLADAVQEATGETVELIYVDQSYTGEKPAPMSLNWPVLVKLPSGRYCRLGGSNTEAEAEHWIKRKPVAWLKDFENGKYV
jgi:hypothetical protein